ncbi:glycosyltransferase family 1 protein [Patescibacteria group bacterium]|nr:MAG: glycosyltransferase family 1 protein [Patescibacteria group bacterium]
MATHTKVLFAITKSNFGGAQRYVYDIARSLPEQFDPVVMLGGDGWLLSTLTQKGIKVVTVPALQRNVRLFSDLRAFFEIVKIIKLEKPDIVHLNSSKMGILGGAAARLIGVKRIIFTSHGWSFNEKRPGYQKKILWILQAITILLAHSTIAVSKDIRNHAPIKKNVVLIYNGIETPRFINKDAARATLTHLSRITSSTKIIGTIGELHKNKGHDILLHAISILKKRDVDTFLVIIGEGEERRRLQTVIERENLSDSAILLGHIDDAATLLKGMDIFVFPSRTEALGYALLEAGLAGASVIASNVGGIPEIVENQVSGILVQSEDPESLADAIELLLKNESHRASLGASLFKNTLEQFSQKSMIRNTVALYEPTPTIS